MFFFWELYDYLAKRTLRQDVPLVAVRKLVSPENLLRP